MEAKKLKPWRQEYKTVEKDGMVYRTFVNITHAFKYLKEKKKEGLNPSKYISDCSEFHFGIQHEKTKK